MCIDLSICRYFIVLVGNIEISVINFVFVDGLVCGGVIRKLLYILIKNS